MPAELLMFGGGIGLAVEAGFVEVDDPQAAGGADDEVAGVGVFQAGLEFFERVPEFVQLLPQTVGKRFRLLGFVLEVGAKRSARLVRVHEE